MTRKFNLALITGATSGIGEALAKLLASKGIPLLLTGRNQAKLEELKSSLKTKVEILAADLSSKEGRKVLIDKIFELKVDLLVNNAGFGFYGEIVDVETKALLEMIELDVLAVVELTAEVAKSMIKNGQKGVIMNVSSVAAFHVLPNLATYSASKAFLNSFSRAVDFELMGKGIRVLASCPGRVATGFQTRASGGKVKSGDGGLFMTSEFAADEIWRQILNEKPVHVFDWKYRFSTFMTHFIPTSWAARIGRSFMKK
jgi:hypothetical protein